MNRVTLVLLYLGAIVGANLLLSWQGPWIAPWSAALLVGLDLSTRDRLHSMWRDHLVRNMALLIVTGSVLSYVLGRVLPTDLPPALVAQVALASALAFGAAAITDAFMYHLLRRRDYYERVNGSNLVAASVDSVLFVALWPFAWNLTYAFTLAAAKVAGGLAWAMVLKRNEWLERNRELYGTR